MKLTMDLTKEELELLTGAVLNYQDEGPEGEGWRSIELSHLCKKFIEAANLAEENEQQ